MAISSFNLFTKEALKGGHEHRLWNRQMWIKNPMPPFMSQVTLVGIVNYIFKVPFLGV